MYIVRTSSNGLNRKLCTSQFVEKCSVILSVNWYCDHVSYRGKSQIFRKHAAVLRQWFARTGFSRQNVRIVQCMYNIICTMHVLDALYDAKVTLARHKKYCSFGPRNCFHLPLSAVPTYLSRRIPYTYSNIYVYSYTRVTSRFACIMQQFVGRTQSSLNHTRFYGISAK